MGFLYVLVWLAILSIVFALVFSILTIWFRNTAMRIISFVLTLLAFSVYLISVFTIGGSDEIFGISLDKLLFLPIAIPLYLQCYFAMKSASTIVAKKIFFGLASLVVVRLLGIAVVAATDMLYKNSLDEISQVIWKVNSYVLFPLLFAGISYVFAKLFYPYLSVFKELFTKTLIILAAITIIDELLNLLVIYTKYKNFIVYDGYTYLIILAVSVVQIVAGCILGLYIFRNKPDKISV
ncbi:MAG: hypothetical protein REI64_04280 [Pedobacter sp.]|uniref:hypothetical protein n=1 Tax=Pedobacter sp. TaxID=1411316 RepID=UPI002809423E|nr:hypothetical protein [Pedobacter sp.]MDQ8003995.1 hypothetical protein [Pedobacter sp.]